MTGIEWLDVFVWWVGAACIVFNALVLMWILVAWRK